MKVASPHALNFSWLVKLRWAASAGQLATIAVVHFGMGVSLPLAPLISVVGLGVASNVACAIWSRRGGPDREWPAAAIMALDVLVLTALLFLTGGPFNPFFTLYLVEIALAAVVLRPRWTWLLVVLSLLCSALLFLEHRLLELPARTHDEHMRLHLQGMWVAFGVTAAFIVWFLMRVVRALSRREAELQAARAQKERMQSLATLAGGAAHELSTPLSTIAVIARELERRYDAEDVQLIRAQVDRCREILETLAGQAGTRAGEDVVAVSLAEVLRDATGSLAAEPRVSVEIAAEGVELTVPPRALAQAVRGLVKNAQDASPAGSAVVVRAEADGDRVRIEVRDRGAGMPPSILERAGEPFFTTKPPGSGMGLGLFLARSVAEQLGGDLALDSREGSGTLATLTIPRRAAATNRRIAER